MAAENKNTVVKTGRRKCSIAVPEGYILGSTGGLFYPLL